ncbi:sulfite exporter TauE/SafE family protein [Paraglaciecola aquimarina]|uniref:Sulfite exporter TauE/SafE family protein n=1 Tax=Paraglaciecola algarum TaxID=3050085 RepID=A0ABS9D2B3_9ALTE|nr:sulfite exporter TauE/SafE family protein [Paraglaciecola sp. G1-23]MCF2947060.1 sulfite exporter TauE/SafE family protein [Paraglaciecola sp. G1-23]
MPELSFISAFLVGLAGGVHCVGMCGGIVGAFSFGIPKSDNLFPYALAYNMGRILSYTLAGCITGWLGHIFSNQVYQGLIILQFFSAVFLLMLALYISGWWHGLTKIEKFGNGLWKHIQPRSKRFIPFKSPLYALPYGILWGWLPCGLVYSILTWSLASGSTITGGLIMFGFGLGTLPVMLLTAMGFEKIKSTIQHPTSKNIISILLLIFASFQLFNTINLSLN